MVNARVRAVEAQSGQAISASDGTPASGFLFLDEGVDVAREDDHGHVAALHDRIVKQAQVEFVSQLARGPWCAGD